MEKDRMFLLFSPAACSMVMRWVKTFFRQVAFFLKSPLATLATLTTLTTLTSLTTPIQHQFNISSKTDLKLLQNQFKTS